MVIEEEQPPADFVLAPGQALGATYRIVRPIGRGGMGEVYQATHARLPGLYAVKLLSPEIEQNQEMLRRFQREAEVTSRLRHPNIVQVIDFDRLEDGTPFLVMELLEGRDLATELRVLGRLPPVRVIDIVDQVASGLAAAHQADVVHRDLKPANLFLSTLPGQRRDLVRILDFGVSKVRASGESLTRTHTLLGTPRYMSPEQARGAISEIDGRTDQFALAAIAYEMLTGEPAFDGEGIATIVYQVVNQSPQSFASRGMEHLRDVEAVLMRGLAKNPADRYSQVYDFAQALGDVAGQRRRGEAPWPVAVAGGTLVSVRVQPKATTTLTSLLGSNDTAPVTVRPASRRWQALAAGVVAIACAGTVIALWAPVPTAPSVAPAPTQAPTIESEKQSEISVELEALPEHAEVRIDGRLAEQPLRLLRDGRSHRLTITAPGYQVHEQSITARRDLVVQLAMIKMPMKPQETRPLQPVRAVRRSVPRASEPPKPAASSNVVTDL